MIKKVDIKKMIISQNGQIMLAGDKMNVASISMLCLGFTLTQTGVKSKINEIRLGDAHVQSQLQPERENMKISIPYQKSA